MRQEKEMILNMLKEDRITVDEALRLLDAITDDRRGSKCTKEREKDVEENLNKFVQSLDSFAKDVGNKVEGTYKDFEPRLKKATKSVIEKTASAVDHVSKSLRESIKGLEDDIPQNVDPQQPTEEQLPVEQAPAKQTEDTPHEN